MKKILFIGAILFVVHAAAQTYTTEKAIFDNIKTTVKTPYGRTKGAVTNEEMDFFGNPIK